MDSWNEDLHTDAAEAHHPEGYEDPNTEESDDHHRGKDDHLEGADHQKNMALAMINRAVWNKKNYLFGSWYLTTHNTYKSYRPAGNDMMTNSRPPEAARVP